MEKRYNTLNEYYKSKYKTKIARIQLDAHMSCPNKDGTKGYGGCIFCYGGSDEFCSKETDLAKQFHAITARTRLKWPNCKFIPYLQANSNTYTTKEHLESLIEPLLHLPDIVEITISTRCDCLEEDILEYLSILNTKILVRVELGLQTANDKTALMLNRGHSKQEFTEGCSKLHTLNIPFIIHIINGLPNETKEDMLATIDYVNRLRPHGIKFHTLLVLKNTRLSTMDYTPLTLEEYIDITVLQMERLDPNIVIYRLCSDAETEHLIKPFWVLKKLVVMNEIDKELKKRNTYQGIYYKDIDAS